MNISQEIENAFGKFSDGVITEEFIERNPNLMEIEGELDLMVIVPAYLKWCMKHGEENGNLVCSYTLSCLSEYGRAKDTANSHLNFKHLCNSQQKSTVLSFLKWCLSNFELVEKKHIERAIKNWQ
ncbi:hypothetical protein [Cellvibrio sp. PSBB023]|uniref:hypothetical protein n=1 Tax=Cellvibrio sp. PSBB023 TaxID=1945512 RepID=UPI00098F97D6|nr:hypothetical protein [Cellvibrio sp. PSBB023]AQT60069.1 hypothetical protein B0D95_08165 [Cellvibrio sp. PSBB023]